MRGLASAPVASRRAQVQPPAGPPAAAFALFLLLTAILFLRPTEIVPALDGLPLFHAVILGCLVISLPWVVGQLRPDSLAARPITACVIVIAATVPLSHLAPGLSDDTTTATTEFFKVVAYFLLLTAVVSTTHRLRMLVAWLLACLAAHTALALLHFHGQVDIPAMNPVYDIYADAETGEAARVARLCGVGLFGNPNDLSRILVVGVALTVYLMVQGPRPALPLLIALAAMFLYALSLTHSRGGLVALAVTGLTALQLRFGGKRTALLGLSALPIALVALGGRQTDMSADAGTGQQRIQLWLEGFNALRESPHLGIGAGRYPELTGGLAAHNSFVECYVELGLVGGTAFLSAFILAVWQSYRLRPAAVRGASLVLSGLHPILIAVVAGYAAGLLTSSRSYVMPTYLVLGMAAVYQTLAAQIQPATAPRLSLRLIGRLTLVCGLAMSVLYLMAQAMVRWQ